MHQQEIAIARSNRSSRLRRMCSWTLCACRESRLHVLCCCRRYSIYSFILPVYCFVAAGLLSRLPRGRGSWHRSDRESLSRDSSQGRPAQSRADSYDISHFAALVMTKPKYSKEPGASSSVSTFKSQMPSRARRGLRKCG